MNRAALGQESVEKLVLGSRVMSDSDVGRGGGKYASQVADGSYGDGDDGGWSIAQAGL